MEFINELLGSGGGKAELECGNNIGGINSE